VEQGGGVEAADGGDHRREADGERGRGPEQPVHAQVEIPDGRFGGGGVVRPRREPEIGANGEGLREDVDDDDPDDGGQTHRLEVEGVHLSRWGGGSLVKRTVTQDFDHLRNL